MMRAVLIVGGWCVGLGVSTTTVTSRDLGRRLFDQSPGVVAERPVETPEAALRGIATLFPQFGLPDIRRHEREVVAFYNPVGGGRVVLTIRVESFDSDKEAEAGRKRSEDSTPGYRTRQEVVGGILCSVWENRRLLGRVSRHVVDVTAAYTPAGGPLIGKVFESLVEPLTIKTR